MENIQNIHGRDIGAAALPLTEDELQTLTTQMEAVQTFDQLEEIINDLKGAIPGSQTVYEKNQLIELISEVKRGELDTRYLTRTGGIRFAAERILQNEHKIETGPGTVPKPGDIVMVQKINYIEGKPSVLQAGKALSGTLLKEIRLGETIACDGGYTSPIQAMRFENGWLIVDTLNSEYKVVVQ